jgi:hypothetical protein
MPSLIEAVGANALHAAYCDVTEATRVVVQETKEGGREGMQTNYAVTMQRGAGLPQRLAEVPTLHAALSRITSLGISGFDGERAEWQPASSGSATTSAMWSDDVGGGNVDEGPRG